MSEERLQLVLTLRSGATVSVHVTSVKVRQNALGSLTELEWTSDDGETVVVGSVRGSERLFYVDLSEVVAVVTRRSSLRPGERLLGKTHRLAGVDAQEWTGTIPALMREACIRSHNHNDHHIEGCPDA